MCSVSAQKKKQPEAVEPQDPNEMVAYLFTYFNSNDPKDEQICFALSDDGYNYTPLNDGMPSLRAIPSLLPSVCATPISCAARMARHSIW
jgi:hypothetical protein